MNYTIFLLFFRFCTWLNYPVFQGVPHFQKIYSTAPAPRTKFDIRHLLLQRLSFISSQRTSREVIQIFLHQIEHLIYTLPPRLEMAILNINLVSLFYLQLSTIFIFNKKKIFISLMEHNWQIIYIKLLCTLYIMHRIDDNFSKTISLIGK